MLKIISWSEFCEGIAPLWKTEPSQIPIINNPFNIIQFPKERWHTDIILFCVKWVEDGEDAAFTCVYNISNTFIRTRGIFVKEEFRGKGIGHKMQQAQWDLFPVSFYRAFGFWREDSAPRFQAYSDMKIVPGTDWLWSDFSQVNMRFLYKDRGPEATEDDIVLNRNFIELNRDKYSFGGTNNLNVDWSQDQWLEYFEIHEGNYHQLSCDLAFASDK